MKLRNPSVIALATALIGTFSLACSTTSGGRGLIPIDRSTCVAVGAAIGGVKGVIIANNTGEGDTDEKAVGAVLGAATGALLGYLLCGEGGPPQAPPTAAIRANPGSGEAPLEVAFAGSGTDPDGRIVGYRWDFGDGTTAEGARVGHRFEQPGDYAVSLEVTDDSGLTASARTQVRVVARAEAVTPPAEPPATRRRIVLRGINFGFDSAQISAEDGLILDIAAEQLRAAPEVSVRVIGHTDATGADAYNQQLSLRRSRAVVEYLIGKGIDRGRLRAEGRGESEPVASNATPDGRRQNRRVALELLE